VIGAVKSVIFDCDGVILDSNHVKTNAFVEAIIDESPQAIAAFIQYHEAHGGVSRYAKFDWFFRDYLTYPDWEMRSKNAVLHFASTVKANLLGAPLVPGIKPLLEALEQAKIPCFVVSGGEHEEVNWLLHERGLSGYFQKILGSPNTKIENLSIIKNLYGLSLPSVFIGDAQSDLQAAQAFNMQFIYVSGYSLWKEGGRICQQANALVVHDVSSISLCNL
jgi:phosphoglycolate phosphatase-like HAD superfamily hydrolase